MFHRYRGILKHAEIGQRWLDLVPKVEGMTAVAKKFHPQYKHDDMKYLKDRLKVALGFRRMPRKVQTRGERHIYVFFGNFAEAKAKGLYFGNGGYTAQNKHDNLSGKNQAYLFKEPPGNVVQNIAQTQNASIAKRQEKMQLLQPQKMMRDKSRKHHIRQKSSIEGLQLFNQALARSPIRRVNSLDTSAPPRSKRQNRRISNYSQSLMSEQSKMKEKTMAQPQNQADDMLSFQPLRSYTNENKRDSMDFALGRPVSPQLAIRRALSDISLLPSIDDSDFEDLSVSAEDADAEIGRQFHDMVPNQRDTNPKSHILKSFSSGSTIDLDEVYADLPHPSNDPNYFNFGDNSIEPPRYGINLDSDAANPMNATGDKVLRNEEPNNFLWPRRLSRSQNLSSLFENKWPNSTVGSSIFSPHNNREISRMLEEVSSSEMSLPLTAKSPF